MARTKFGNTKSGGYDSRKEHRRAQELQILEKCGAIKGLCYQQKFELTPKMGSERPSYYVADFTYTEAGKFVCEDVKGMRTPLYILKRKMMRHRYGIAILET